ncbi:S9 family peptidase [Nitritalea halalkaliphila LW7]|uniref:Proline-specific endopeptidase n=1 Tax=Nitritalea halalkaliphila LW7 TaxID=1189621 RepID=I5BXW0_9BACT|nr:oligopeptidase B [Nitritalea halalkaliphila]EIM74412.1 S9 family peptidase [Nitritalea halalkaliphila LW7]
MSTDSQQPFVYPDLQPPVAAEKSHTVIAPHGHRREDPYYWLRERDNPEVLAYLKAENAYLARMLAHTNDFQQALFQEMRARIKEDDSSVPYFLGGYWYATRYQEGGEYPLYVRRKGSLEAPEEVLVDGNALAEGLSFLNFFISVSHDHQRVAIILDTQGRNFYRIQVKDLLTGELLPDSVPDVRSSAVWAPDNASFYYTIPDPVTLRNYQVKRHVLGTDASEDQVIFEEKDETLDCGVYLSRSKAFLLVHSSRTDASVSYVAPVDRPEELRLFSPLSPGVQYHVEHAGGAHFYIHTNWNAPNYRLMRCGLKETSAAFWVDFLAHRPKVFLEDVLYFQDFIVFEEKEAGLAQLRVLRRADGDSHVIAFHEPAYAAGLGHNPDFQSTTLRYQYTSMTTPHSTFAYGMETRVRELLKEQEVLGDFDRSLYRTERVWVPAADGAQIPLSLVYRIDRFRQDGSMPGWIYAYGAYGYSMEATFSTARLSLLDRGMVYAIAHVRGGQELGGDWYAAGKMLQKQNTFDDFIACSRWLQEQGYVAKDKLFASGGSAGGLLIGAVYNQAPELYRGLIAAVPFVDVLTTMLDDSIPLTTFEWLEWGNPANPEEYAAMLAYSPYDNVRPQAYPSLLVTTGFHDSQVQYWEPAKWVARLRKATTAAAPIFLQTYMDAGHGGASGRFERLKEVALEYAFVFDLLGVRA